MFLRRVGQARFERRPTIGNHREIRVGRRGEAPLVPPYKLRRPNKVIALVHRRFRLLESPPTVPLRSGPSGRGESDLVEESPGFTGHGGG